MLPEAVLVMVAALPTQDFRDVDVRESAVEIARVVTDAPRPLFKTRELDAAVLLTTDYAEARFVHNAVGDGGTALCEFQLHDAPRSVLTDLGECVDIGYERLRLSVRMCPDAPLAQYIGGCTRKSARWQSEYRMNIARRILAEAQKRREFRSPSHLVRDMVEDALLPPVVRSRGRPRLGLRAKADRVRVRRSYSRGQSGCCSEDQRQTYAARNVELRPTLGARKVLDALRREWPYEPGWYTLNDDGYMCSGETCTRRNAPALSKTEVVYIGLGVGEIYCRACQFERRTRPAS